MSLRLLCAPGTTVRRHPLRWPHPNRVALSGAAGLTAFVWLPWYPIWIIFIAVSLAII
jgi:hypothetical protein